jgi:heptosyltransferase II
MKILVFTKNWIGDVIFEMAAIRVIRENYPKAHLIAVTTPRCVPVLEACPHVNEVISFDEKGDERSLASQIRFVWQLRSKKIDQAFLFHRSGTRARMAFLAGIPKRIGYATKGRGAFLTQSIEEPEDTLHDVRYFVDLVKQAGLKSEGDYQYDFYFSKADDEKAERLIQKNNLPKGALVAVNPGANWAPKRWPTKYYAELIQKLMREYGVQVVLTGSEDDKGIVQEIISDVSYCEPREVGQSNLGSQISSLPAVTCNGGGRQIVSLCGETSICELGAFYSKCELLISNDSGPMHVGTGVGTNVIGIFGPTQPLETAPMGRGKNIVVDYAPSGVTRPWIGNVFPGNWMEQISVDHVLQVIRKERLLNQKNAVLT